MPNHHFPGMGPLALVREPAVGQQVAPNDLLVDIRTGLLPQTLTNTQRLLVGRVSQAEGIKALIKVRPGVAHFSP